MKKRVDLLWMRKWWKQVEAWIDANLTALFDNDEELERGLNDVKADVETLKSGGVDTSEIPELDGVDDDYTVEEMEKVILRGESLNNEE